MTDTADDLVGRLRVTDETRRTCGSVDVPVEVLDQAADRISADQARIQVLEAALKPLADIGIANEPDFKVRIFKSDVERARQALSQSPTIWDKT